jgi:nucleotide-binding universal stress UspA family protein
MMKTTTTVTPTTAHGPTQPGVLERILIAVDGSIASDIAARTVGSLVRGHAAEVFVIHVSGGGPLVSSEFGPDAMTLRWGTPATAQHRVDEALRMLDAMGVHATGRVYSQTNTMGAEIVDVSRSLHCGLIALGTGRRGLFGASVLGGVARPVVHHADRPILVTTQFSAVPAAFERILVAVDGSVQAERATAIATEVATVVGAEVVVLHVSDPHGTPWTRYEAGAVILEQDTPSTADSLVDRAAEMVTAKGAVARPLVRALTEGVSSDILAAATSFDCAMVIVGSHGHPHPGSALGSVASGLLRSATVPILVAR